MLPIFGSAEDRPHVVRHCSESVTGGSVVASVCGVFPEWSRPYINLASGLATCGCVLWVGVRGIEKLGFSPPLGPREECRARLDDWFQGQLEANAKHATVGLKMSVPARRSWACTATWTRGCVPRRTQVFFAVAPGGSYARSWAELSNRDVGVLAEQFSIGPVDAEPYFRRDEPGTAVCVAQMDEDSEFDVWSVSIEDRTRDMALVHRGELVHEHDDQPPAPPEPFRW